MRRIIFCTFLKKKTEGQDIQIYPGELGKKIYNHISKQAWKKWLSQQTILINEKKLNTFNLQDRMILEKHMKLFLFKE
ncbi:MAG: oxidative damage protection protein [Buchnera aphidicola (Pentalonia nigronervosa)]|jgi:Fe-S cluster biosynthesis and repair protein YggX|uniref:Probable Fe(2+)-trafficking protein n=1 Tax=Buchnera aphidicola (Pentalonia nigronervosa) TaxID=1309793 RepID=A0A7H1AZ19_9GAMM|nr:MAG: oxidative damage protection protein [Buchnera aphidicola (Pentalonia nigronervosa)]